MRAVRLFVLFVSFLVLCSLNAEAQVTLVVIPVPLQFFGGVQIKGGLQVNSGGEIEKSSRFAFEVQEKSFRLPVTGYTLSLYPDRTGYATIYFGADVTDSDYVQVRGEVVMTGAKLVMLQARVTTLRLHGVNVRP